MQDAIGIEHEQVDQSPATPTVDDWQEALFPSGLFDPADLTPSQLRRVQRQLKRMLQVREARRRPGARASRARRVQSHRRRRIRKARDPDAPAPAGEVLA